VQTVRRIIAKHRLSVRQSAMIPLGRQHLKNRNVTDEIYHFVPHSAFGQIIMLDIKPEELTSLFDDAIAAFKRDSEERRIANIRLIGQDAEEKTKELRAKVALIAKGNW